MSGHPVIGIRLMNRAVGHDDLDLVFKQRIVGAFFTGLALDGSARDATPSAGSALRGAGAAAYAAELDLLGRTRTGPLDSGAVDADG